MPRLEIIVPGVPQPYDLALLVGNRRESPDLRQFHVSELSIL
jgi:hypothetical protein